jgi:hypothetical protein
MSQVAFCPGDGTTIMLEVAYMAEFLRDNDGVCAFCHGDPCAEESGTDTPIGAYFQRNPNSETCPCCKGRPS